MKKLEIKDVVNEDSVAVFTDASMEGRNGCAGCIVLRDDYSLTYHDLILENVTVARAELLGIRLGLREAIKEEKRNVNLFSDSLISVKGLRVWIFDWVKNYKSTGKLTNSSNKPVMNADIICDIVNLIIENPEVNINIFHQKGHIKDRDVDKVIKLFYKENDKFTIDEEFVFFLQQYNDFVDNNTRLNLTRNLLKKKYSKHSGTKVKVPDIHKHQYAKKTQLIF